MEEMSSLGVPEAGRPKPRVAELSPSGSHRDLSYVSVLGLEMAVFLCVITSTSLSECISVQLPHFCKGTSHVGLGLTLMTSV